MRRLIVLIGTLAVLGLVTPVANACTCNQAGAPCEAYGTAAAVTIKGYIGQTFAVQAGISGPKTPNGAPPIPIGGSMPQRISIERATQTIKIIVPP